jgi:hypothetical protein
VREVTLEEAKRVIAEREEAEEAKRLREWMMKVAFPE